MITPHDVFLRLDPEENSRQAAYRELFRMALEPGLVDQIRMATNGNFCLGDHRFAEEMAVALCRRVTPGKSGRPRKLPEPESSELFN